MAVTYRLTLAGDISVEQVAEGAIPDPAERPRRTDSGRLLSVDLYQQRGFGLSVRSGHDGHFEAEADDESRWEWTPEIYVNLTFAMDKNDLVDKGTPNMLAVVARVLAARPEDAALTLNGDVLLLTRVDGVLRKHNRDLWWDHYGFVHEIVPG